MKITSKKSIIIVLVVFIIGISIGTMINSLRSNKKIVSGYSFEISEKNIINKKLQGKYLDSFVTIVEPQKEFSLNIEGIDSDSNVFVINPTDGNMISMNYDHGKFKGKLDLERDVNYGIILDYELVGSIRVVDDVKKIEEETLFTEILIELGCGL